MSENRKLWVKITGIDMDLEAWGLIRLFFNDDLFAFIKEESTDDGFTPGAYLDISVVDGEEWFCKVDYYYIIEMFEMIKNLESYNIKPQYSSKKQISTHDIKKPGGRLFKSQKIIVGACIVEVLSKVTGKQLPYGSLTGIRPVKLALQCIDDGLNKTDTKKQLVRATCMNEEKAALLYDIAVVERPFINIDLKSVHLYIGIPFCKSRCLYCSFTSYPVERYASLIPRFMDALEKEIRYARTIVEENKLKVKSVYIGGGTPTALDNSNLNRVLQLVNESFDINNVEFTVEAGRPDTITHEKLNTMKMNNITRISINPQTMNASTLKAIGRNHTPEDIVEKFNISRDIGFNNINMDIIAGLPNEDEEMFKYTLDCIEKMAPESLTVHTMAIKRASILHENLKSYNDITNNRNQNSHYKFTPDKIVEWMVEYARKSAEGMGMRPYYLYRQKNILANLENTGYAKVGYECIYNIHTMEEVQSIIAMGAGSISKFVSTDGKKIKRTYNVKEVTQYIDRIDEMIERKKAEFEKVVSS